MHKTIKTPKNFDFYMDKNKEVRPDYILKVILALILATLLFISVFFFGYMVSYYKSQATIQSQESLRYSLLGFEVEREILGNSCADFDPHRFTSEIDNMGRVISLLEQRLGKANTAVLDQKRTYALLEARHLLYVQDHNLRCNQSVPTILFFYSNNQEDKDGSTKMGYMLSSLKNRNPEVLIYSFDSNLDSSLTLLLKQKYNVTSPNTLVINGKTFSTGLNNVEDILFNL